MSAIMRNAGETTGDTAVFPSPQCALKRYPNELDNVYNARFIHVSTRGRDTTHCELVDKLFPTFCVFFLCCGGKRRGQVGYYTCRIPVNPVSKVK